MLPRASGSATVYSSTTGQIGPDDRVNVSALREMTDDSGGRTEIVRDSKDLDRATATIADELSKQYYLGYPRALTGGSTFTKVTLARRSKSSCRSKPGSCTHRTCAIFVASWSARRLRLASSSRWTNRRGRCGREAASAGFYKSPWGEHPKLQILTVGELLDGKPIDMPPIRQTSATFERAPRAKSKGAKLPQLEFDGED